MGRLNSIRSLIASIGFLAAGLCLQGCRAGVSNQVQSQSANALEVSGEWKTACVADPHNSADSLTSLTFSGTNRKKITTLYSPQLSGVPCSGAPMSVHVEEQSLVISRNPDGTVNTEISFTTVKETIYDAHLLDSYIKAKICGTDQWAAGVEKDITAAPCGNATGKPYKEQKYYDLEKLDGDKYYLGKIMSVSTGSAPEKRPTEVDMTRPFSRN